MYKDRPSIVIAFMGVDGSGKSTLIKQLNKHLKKKYTKIKNLHLRPYFFLTDTRTVIKDPHGQKMRSKFISLLIIFNWLFVYRIFFFIPVDSLLNSYLTTSLVGMLSPDSLFGLS